MRERTVFSSRDLPAHLTDAERFNLWYDLYRGLHGEDDISIADRPFASDITVAQVGTLHVAMAEGTLVSADRTRSVVRQDGRDEFVLILNYGQKLVFDTGRIAGEAPRGGALLGDYAEGGRVAGPNGSQGIAWANVVVPRRLLLDGVSEANDLVAQPIMPGEALSLLGGYLRLVQQHQVLTSELGEHIANTIVDLMALSLGAKGDAGQAARMRGLRAARLQAVLARIRATFTDPLISAQGVAEHLNLSERYVHLLLQETGLSFTERVLELRLLKVYDMLGDERYRSMRISDIAYAAGFSDISYFNHKFRKRFGMTPTAAR